MIRRRGSPGEEHDEADDDRAERRADERDQVEDRDHDRERERRRHAEDREHDEGCDAGDGRLQQGAADIAADGVAPCGRALA